MILIDSPSILLTAGYVKTDLIEDVNRSLEILRSMDQMVVAIRYADLLRDILEVVGQSHINHQSSQTEGVPARDVNSNINKENPMECQGAGAAEIGGNIACSLQATAQFQPPQNSILSRDDVLAHLVNHNPIGHFEARSDEMMFGALEGWNVAGNVFSDFSFAGENNDASLWDWEHN